MKWIKLQLNWMSWWCIYWSALAAFVSAIIYSWRKKKNGSGFEWKKDAMQRCMNDTNRTSAAFYYKSGIFLSIKRNSYFKKIYIKSWFEPPPPPSPPCQHISAFWYPPPHPRRFINRNEYFFEIFSLFSFEIYINKYINLSFWLLAWV